MKGADSTYIPEVVVYPAFLPQLSHGGVDPWVASPPLPPQSQQSGVCFPRQLEADWVVFCDVIVWHLHIKHRDEGEMIRDS